MIRDDFFTDPKGGYPSLAEKQFFLRIWKRVEAFEKETGKSLDGDLEREDFIALFQSLQIRRASYFARVKTNLTPYFRYLATHGAVSAVTLENLRSVSFSDLNMTDSHEAVIYFKDLEQLRTAIAKATKSGDGDLRESVYAAPTAALYLAWFGLTMEQTVALKKSDVTADGVMVDSRLVELPLEVTETLLALRDMKGFVTTGRGVMLKRLVPSEYLFRSDRSAHMTAKALTNAISRLKAAGDNRDALNYSVAYRSGLYNRVYTMERESDEFPIDDPEFAAKVFERDPSDMHDHNKFTTQIANYNYYKTLFE